MALLLGCAHQPLQVGAGYDVTEKSVAALQADMAAGRISSQQLVAAYVARIRTLDERGPALHSVLALNSNADDDARRLDDERKAGKLRGPLHGIPILLKDNIESAEPLPTTAGSLALLANVSGRDAPIVARLRDAGAIVLGKANLSEWANIRSKYSTSGWSAVGGSTKNPYDLERNPCGSSSGSGAAVAANLTTLAIGTETNGSITCPASVLGLVGLKPTLGLVSRTHIIPISTMQDTAGPLARTVEDAAVLLQVIAGEDPEDPATFGADARKRDYLAELTKTTLAGRRLGVLKSKTGFLPAVDALFDQALQQLTAAGAELTQVELSADVDAIEARELTVLITDFRDQLNAYLAAAPPAVRVRTLAELITFNSDEAARELVYFGQDLFVAAEATAGYDPHAYSQLREANRKAAADALDSLLTQHRLDALIAPTLSPAWKTDLVNGDHVLSSVSTLPAVAGYPHLTVPMGQVSGLPVGLSFIGPAWSDATLLALGYSFEQRTRMRRPPALR
ncbi:MAG TPA: amidase [Polyangiales bacterium]|nr:amidase [Polyangiales bacterium]